MGIELEFPEIPGDAGPPAFYLRVARLSLLEEQERSAIDEIRHKSQNEDPHNSGRKHSRGLWHKHARDHRHNHDIEKNQEHGHQHDHKHKHGSMHRKLQDPQYDPEIGEEDKHVHDPSNKPPHGPPRGPPHGSPHGPPHGPPRGPPHGSPHRPPHGPPHGRPHSPPHDHHKDGHLPGGRGPPPPYIKDPNAPEDKGHFVLIIIGLFGLVHMMPFMFFFTANEYWMYKFRNTTTESTDANDRTYLQTNFASLNKLTVTAPGVICNFIAAVGGHKIKAETRVFCVLAIHSSILIAQAVFATIDTDDWQVMFFIITMLLQMVMACAMSLGGSGSMGLISKLPPHYMKAQLIGEGISGVFSAVLRLISIFCTPSTVGAALMYFVTGSILMVITSVIFYFATQTKFFKYYTQSSKEERKEKIRNIGDFKEVLKIMWPMLILNTLPMWFPAQSITNLVVSEYYGTESVWGNKYFITFCTYLIPSLTGLIGRGIFSYMDYDCSIPTLGVLVVSRELIFGALILLVNAKPRHHLPVLLPHDWEYGLTMAGNSLSAGFMMTLSMLKSMRMVSKDRIELSMMCNMFFMSIVMAASSPLGVLVVNLI